MNIGIVGAGSVGLLIASLLNNQHNITVYTKRDCQKEQLNVNGIKMYDGESIHITNVNVKTITELSNQDLYIICVKQPQIESLLNEMDNIFTNVPLLFIQNGMTHIESLQLSSHPTYIGVFEHGVRRISDYEIEYNGKGLLRIAKLHGDSHEYHQMIKEIDSEQFPIKLEHDMMKMLLQKLAINSIINSLTTLFMIPNGKIIENTYINRIAKMFSEEIATILAFDKVELWKKVTNIAQKTATNESSMLQDFKNGKETEVESILGYVLQYNNQSKPYTMFLYQAIKARIKEREFKNET